MGPRSVPDLYIVKCMTGLLYALAVLVTILRIYVRAKVRVWWWDDSLAFCAMLSMALFVIGVCFVTERDEPLTRRESFYPMMLGYYLTIWLSRLSILFTVIRFAPLASQRKALGYLAGILILQCTLLMVEAVWYFENIGHPWDIETGGQPRGMTVSQLISTMITDALLIISPIKILRHARLDPWLQTRLVAAVFISVIATIFTVIHAVIALSVAGMWAAIFCLLEVFVALFACNAYVMAISIMVQRARRNTTTATDGPIFSTVLFNETSFQDASWIGTDSTLTSKDNPFPKI